MDNVFEFMIVIDPTEAEKKKGSRSKIIGKDTVIAKNEDEAKLVASRSIPETHAEALDRIRILVRPFYE